MKKPVLITLFFTTLFTGCTPLREVRFDTIQNSSHARANAIIKKSNSQVYKNDKAYMVEDITSDVIEFDHEAQNIKERIRILEDIIEDMDGINEANVVIMETAAIVSINITDEITNKKLVKLKQEIEQEIKLIDSSIKQVSVTTSPEFVEKLNNIGKFPEGDNINITEEQQDIIRNLRPAL